MVPPQPEELKVGTEITVRISLTFQEAPDVHTLLAMTPVRERGKLVRLALQRYIVETAHPAGDVEEQVRAISAWLRSRGTIAVSEGEVPQPTNNTKQFTSLRGTELAHASVAELNKKPSSTTDASICRWLQT